MYKSIEEALKGFVSDVSSDIVNNINLINKVISVLMKEIENMKIGDIALSGSDKKRIVIQLGRIIVSKYVVNSKNGADTLYMYDNIVDLTVENIIDVSNVVNITTTNTVCTSISKIFNILLRYIFSSNFLNL